MKTHDSHCHFFSPRFFAALAAQKGLTVERPADEVTSFLGWDAPGSVDALSDRWASELDKYDVGRAALIASVPGDEGSVLGAVQRHPERFVGFFMVDPNRENAAQEVEDALASGLSCVCLFPAMHHFHAYDEKARAIFKAAAQARAAVFVHCGVLSVGVRKKLGLPSRFDMRLGNPLDLHAVALDFPELPIVIPHFGAGFFREALMVADLCSNIYFDTSSSNSWMRYSPDLTLEKVFARALDVLGPERLLFGTDSSFFPRGWQAAIWETERRALEKLGVSSEDQRRIFVENFDRLFPVA